MLKFLLSIFLSGWQGAFPFAAGAPAFPWQLDDPIVVVDGNSISAGYGLAGGELTWPQLLAQDAPFNNPNITWYNFAVSAQQTSQMSADAATQIDPLVTAGRPLILIAWEVTNSLYYGNSVQASFDQYKAYCLARRAAGVHRIVAVTCLPRNNIKQDGTSAVLYNQDIDAVNVLIRQRYREFADALVDVRTAPELATVQAAYMPDGIHPNQAGLVVFKNLIKPTLLRLRK